MLVYASDGLRNAALGDAKILRFQTANGLALMVLDNDAQHDGWLARVSRRRRTRWLGSSMQTARRLRS